MQPCIRKSPPSMWSSCPPIYNPPANYKPPEKHGCNKGNEPLYIEGLPSTYVLAMKANGRCTRLHFEHLRSQYPSRLFSFCENKTGRFLSHRATPFVEPKPLQNYSAV